MSDNRKRVKTGESLHVRESDSGGWEVWLNHDVDFSGFPIGRGETREDALEDAAYALALLGVAVQGLFRC